MACVVPEAKIPEGNPCERTGGVVSWAAQLWLNTGRLTVVPQLLASVQVRVCELLEHTDQAVQVQDSTHACVVALTMAE